MSKNQIVYDAYGNCYIETTHAPTGKVDLIQIDEADMPLLTAYSWQVNNSGYARTTAYNKGKHYTLYMHRYLLDCPDDLEVHHRDNNKLNNTRANIEVCNRMYNLLKVQSDGVSLTASGRYKTGVRINRRWINLGLWASEVQARVVYDAARDILCALPIRYTQTELDAAMRLVKQLRSGSLSRKQSRPRCAKGYSRNDNGRYYARICINGKIMALGGYDTPEEAAAAYDKEVAKYKTP